MTDADRVRSLLGREPRGAFEVVVRDPDGDPAVIRNAPLLDDGTPMPTRYWLVDPDEIRRIGRLESAGGVDRAEAEVDPAALADAHARYAAERDAAVPDDHTGPRPSGGVGGTRLGVKCLHAHWAWHLAGGDDPVGRWIEARLAELPLFEIGEEHLVVTTPDLAAMEMPWGTHNLTARWLAEHDPPRPEDLTNALGTIDDELDDLVRLHPDVDGRAVTFRGPAAGALAALEAGHPIDDRRFELRRRDADELFRLVATVPAGERADEPGLPAEHAPTIVATLCIVLAVMRRFRLGHVQLVLDVT